MRFLKQLAIALFLSVATVSAYAEYEVQSTSASFSRAELDQILAPIALYPDSVLSHILIAATYPLEVVMADRWSQSHSNLRPEQALNAVESQSWDPSVKALVSFPDILKRMSENLDWTQQVGDAFLDDEALVMDVIQGLRQRAFEAGNLNDMQYAKAYREDKVIIIEPSVERVVYVPYYDPRVIYGRWWWPNYPPVYWNNYYEPRHNHVSSGFYWGPRIQVSTGFYFSAFHWSNRRVVVVDNHHHKPNTWGYTNRTVSRSHEAKHWQHDVRHRGGVTYRGKQQYHHDRPARDKKSETFRPHDKNYREGKNSFSGHRGDYRGDYRQDQGFKQSYSAAKSAEREKDKNPNFRQDQGFKQNYSAAKSAEREKDRNPNFRQDQSFKQNYSAAKAAEQKKDRDPKKVRWNISPPDHNSNLRDDKREKNLDRNRHRDSNKDSNRNINEVKDEDKGRGRQSFGDRNDRKSQFNNERQRPERERRSAPVDTEQKTPRGTKFEPRPENKRFENQSSRRSHHDRDSDKKGAFN